jgi:hypothetical protein
MIMTAAAAARKWWAAQRRRTHASAPAAAGDGKASVSIELFLPLFVAGAMLLCAATGFTATRLSESRIEGQQYAALGQALDEFHARFGDGGRELQSLHDARGRIVGWFSRAGDCGVIGVVNRLWGILALVGAALALCAGLTLRSVRQLSRSLDRSAETVRAGRTFPSRSTFRRYKFAIVGWSISSAPSWPKPGTSPSRVVLEVTEGVLIDNPQEAQTRLEALRAGLA